jgi:hypothetical protein
MGKDPRGVSRGTVSSGGQGRVRDVDSKHRRFLLVAALLLAPVAVQEARANSCRTAAVCATTPCDFDTPTSWAGCAGTFPQTTDTWTVQAGHTVMLDANVSTRGALILGTFRTVPAPGMAQSIIGPAGAVRTLSGTGVSLTLRGTPSTELNIGASGLFQMSRGDSLVCDSTTSSCEYVVNSGGRLDLEGFVQETTVTALTDAEADAATCGTTLGRKWTISVADGAQFAAVNGRVRLLSGRARDREFEIVAVSASAVTVCTLLDDAMSVSAYGGQRLTPHAAIGGLATRHHVPTVADSTSPFYAAPSAGDEVALIQDVTLKQIGGSHGFRILQGLKTGLTVAPVFHAVHFNGIGIPGTPSIYLTAASPGLSFGTFDYINLHDYNGRDQFLMGGWQDSTFRYVTGHDADVGAGESAGILVPTPARVVDGASGDFPADGVDILDSTFYRTRGNAINFNVSNTTLFSTGNVFRGNLVFEGCTTDTGECGGIEVNACQFCDVSYNAVYDICRKDGTEGDLVRLGGGGGADVSRGSVAHHNWLVNGCGEGLIASYGGPDSGRDVTVTANYISHVRHHGGNGGRWFGDVIRNWGLDNSSGRDGLHNPQEASSVWLLGNDAGIASGEGCAAGCSGNGVYFDNVGVNAPGQTAVLRDVLVSGLDSPAGDGVRVDSSVDFDLNLDQISCDNLGAASDCCLRVKATSPIHVSATDLTAESLAGGTAVCCSDAAVETIGNLLYSRSFIPADNVKVSTASCNGVGAWNGVPNVGHVNPLAGNYNYVPGAPGLTFAEGGGPIGFHTFRSPKDAINGFWSGLLPFDQIQPADVTSSSDQDTDGDGVIDLYDNCDLTWNPAQNGPSCPGVCLPGEAGTPCDDGNPCTGSDLCDASGGCGGTPIAGPACDDGSACTTGDLCVARAGGGVRCAGTPRDCSDGDLCTDDVCDPATGLCAGVPIDCVDENSCVLDVCDRATGLCRPDRIIPCGDGNECTVDLCADQTCAPVAKADGVPCGDACSGGTATCRGGVCTGATTTDCDDGNPCTTDGCDPLTGCVHEGPLQASKEMCNGIDDDCDGLIDEREIVPVCTMSPSSVWIAGTLAEFSLNCRFTPACAVPGVPPFEPIGPAWLSAADSATNSADNVVLPNPYDDCAGAIVEDTARRLATSIAVTFVFDANGDGVCGTSGGGGAGLLRDLAGVPVGDRARVCLSWRREGFGDTERCTSVLIMGTVPPPVETDPISPVVRPAP